MAGARPVPPDPVDPAWGTGPQQAAMPEAALGSGLSDGNGADRDRTGDPLLAKQVLSQLSYRPSGLRRSLTRNHSGRPAPQE